LKNHLYIFLCLILFPGINMAQTVSKFIIVDQFGYLPDAQKIAVIKDPQVGFDADESFTPGQTYIVVNAITGEHALSGIPVSWNNGATDESSGDKTWHFDFSPVSEIGRYYILDVDNNVRSFEFEISPIVYNEVLKQAMRMFFYQRAGCAKEARYAGAGWADGASHIGPLQDKNCRLFSDKNNPATERDLSGGWYDAGDFNKYTNWTANYVVEMMKAWLEKPDAWADNYNIPESGNGIPDLLDEAKWGIDFLLRMQQTDGGVLCIVGESHASPPSSATGQSLYGPATSSASLNSSAAFALSSKVYRAMNMIPFADTLMARAIKAWNWAETNPAVVFNNNSAENSSLGVGAGNQEEDEYTRFISKLEAACFLFDVTKDITYRNYFDDNYSSVHLITWSFAYPYEPIGQDLLLYYTQTENATSSICDDIRNVYRSAMQSNTDNFPAWFAVKDPYRAHLGAYTWGSNGQKGAQGTMYYNMKYFGLNPSKDKDAVNAAQGYIHYIHGVNPLNMAYLSNMYAYGGDNTVNEFYHTWFCNGSAKWDRVGTSLYGPPPGFLTGGANPGYNWAGCCPGGCGSSANNAACLSESISPPKNQPKQKSYKDFNTSWPLNSWEITENSCGYQVNYIRLLSKFVAANLDCHGDSAGTAYYDTCGICSGGNTERMPTENICQCPDFRRKAVINPVACRQFISPSGKYVWDSSGVYADTIPAINGCDSMVTVNLTIPEINTLVVRDGNILLAQQTDAGYQWLQCNNNYRPIVNASNAGYTPDQSGMYAVEIALNNCKDTSDCYEVSIIDVINNTLGDGLIFSPNPTAGLITIILPEAYDKTDVELTDQKGKTIMKESYSQRKEISLSLDEPAGLYFLTIRNSRNQNAVVKIIKK
jgi:endoglucanase